MDDHICFNDAFTLCNILEDTFIVTEEFNKKDFSRVERLTGSGAVILNEIKKCGTEAGISKEALCQRIFDIYAVEDSEKQSMSEIIEKFVSIAIEKGYLLKNRN